MNDLEFLKVCEIYKGFGDGELKDNEVYISDAYQKKFLLNVDDEITLKEKYSNKKYTFKIKGIIDYPVGLSVFLYNDSFSAI